MKHFVRRSVGVIIWIALLSSGYFVSWGAPEILALALGVCFYYLAYTVSLHRYFAHRAFAAKRSTEFCLGLWACTLGLNGPIEFASYHRLHHRFSDTELDPHSSRRGFWWAFYLWHVKTSSYSTANVQDLLTQKSVRMFQNYHGLIFLAHLALVASLLPLSIALAFGFFSLGIVWLVISSSTYFLHRWGEQKYATRDWSCDNALLGLFLFGEGWHNSHHHRPHSAKLAPPSSNLDLGYLLILLFKKMGWVQKC